MILKTVNIQSLLMMTLVELGLIRFTVSCGGRSIIHSGVSEHDKQLILDSHNKIRQIVALGQVGNQPPAANMAKLKWSDHLAHQAQQWTETCSSSIHDPGRHNGNYFVGQNIATKWTTRPPSSYYDMEADWNADAIIKWFKENTLYSFGGSRGGHTGHYTQLIWAQTTQVGCGYIFYLDGNRYTKKYVCNYGPSGNVIGEPPYQMGYPSCFSHGLSDSRAYPGLCDTSNNEVVPYYNNQYSRNYHYPHGYTDYDTSNDYFYRLLNYVGYPHK